MKFIITHITRAPHGNIITPTHNILDDEMAAMRMCKNLQDALAAAGITYGFEPIDDHQARELQQRITLDPNVKFSLEDIL